MAEITRTETMLSGKRPRKAVERTLALVGEIMRYLLEQPRVIESLPDDFELIILPDDDPALRRYNLELLNTLDAANKPVVFARLKSSRKATPGQLRPRCHASRHRAVTN